MIIFKNISAESMGVVFDTLPSIPIGAPRHQSVSVPGRDGNLTIPDDSREAFNITLSGHFIDMNRKDVTSWLVGFGHLFFDEETDRFLKAKVIDIVELPQQIKENQAVKFIVIFECQPYFCLTSGQEVIAVNANTVTLINPGNIEAFPRIKIIGNGNLEIRQSGKLIMSITDVAEYIEIDSEADLVHKGALSWEKKTSGNCPILGIGQTTITVSGDVTGIEIVPNWRIR